MKLNLRQHYSRELELAKQAMKNRSVDQAWEHLARAHILGQFYVLPHLETHFLMFIYAIKTLNLKEMIGQIPRLLLATPGSLLKKAPLGNTGLSNVGIFEPMKIPADLQDILNMDH